MIITILISALSMMSGTTNMYPINKQKHTSKNEIEMVKWPDFFIKQTKSSQNKLWGYN